MELDWTEVSEVLVWEFVVLGFLNGYRVMGSKKMSESGLVVEMVA